MVDAVGGGVVDDAMMGRVVTAVEGRIARLLQDRDRQLAEQLSKETRQAVAGAMAGFNFEIQRNIANTVSQKVEKAVAKQLEALPDLVAKSMSNSQAGIAAAMKEPMGASFKQCFAEQLIPAFQSATQRMFTQITEALQKSLAANEAGATSSEATLQQLSALQKELQSFSRVAGSLSGRLEAIEKQISTLGTPAPPMSSGGGAGGVPDDFAKLKRDLCELVGRKDYDNAFQKALSASNLEMVVWLCSESVLDDIFDPIPPLLSPTVQLCLMQQLGFRLEEDTALKLEWLKQISLVFKPHEPEIAAYVGGVLEQLHKSLQAAAPQITRQSDAKELRFVLKAVRQLQESAGR